MALLSAGAEGVRLSGGRVPGYRERSFAAYSLGFLAARSNDLEVQKRVLTTMTARAQDRQERMDVRVAAIHALRSLSLPPDARAERKLQLAALVGLALDAGSSMPDLIQVQALTALRGPLQTQGLERERLERKMAAKLMAGRSSAAVRQSLSQTLGFLADSEDLDVVHALERTVLRDKDELCRRYAIIALGRIGGQRAQAFLLAGIGRPRPRKAEYAWLALALAVSCQRAEPDGTLVPGAPRKDIGEALHERFQDLNGRMPAAGVAIALGLMRHVEAADDIEERLARWRKHDEPAAYLALSLGLLGNTASRSVISSMLDSAGHREVLVVQTSLALSLLGDRRAATVLQGLLQQKQSAPVLSALAMGLGRLGSRRSIDVLSRRLVGKEGDARSRAFMAVALGELLVRRRLRWNAALSWGVHYRYSPATLTGSAGVLDLL